MKTCLILGAGSTFADAKISSFKPVMPPLDKNFFADNSISYVVKKKKGKIVIKKSPNKFITKQLKDYFWEKYGYDICQKDSPYNSLEKVLQILYTDIYISDSIKEGKVIEGLLVGLIAFVKDLIVSTTKRNPSKEDRLTGVIRKLLKDCAKPEELTIVSYNYDLQSERTLDYLSLQYKRRYKDIFKFPKCYCLPEKDYHVTAPKSSTVDTFQERKKGSRGVKILKPHGSLNWYSLLPKSKTLLEHVSRPKKKIMISRRKKIPEGMTLEGKKTFPLIIPPLAGKGAIFKKSIVDRVWTELRNELSSSSRIVIYGYSCPETDVETFNLLCQVFRWSKQKKELHIINPDASVISRFQTAVDSPMIRYYKNADLYV